MWDESRLSGFLCLTDFKLATLGNKRCKTAVLNLEGNTGYSRGSSNDSQPAATATACLGDNLNAAFSAPYELEMASSDVLLVCCHSIVLGR